MQGRRKTLGHSPAARAVPRRSRKKVKPTTQRDLLRLFFLRGHTSCGFVESYVAAERERLGRRAQSRRDASSALLVVACLLAAGRRPHGTTFTQTDSLNIRVIGGPPSPLQGPHVARARPKFWALSRCRCRAGAKWGTSGSALENGPATDERHGQPPLVRPPAPPPASRQCAPPAERGPTTWNQARVG